MLGRDELAKTLASMKAGVAVQGEQLLLVLKTALLPFCPSAIFGDTQIPNSKTPRTPTSIRPVVDTVSRFIRLSSGPAIEFISFTVTGFSRTLFSRFDFKYDSAPRKTAARPRPTSLCRAIEVAVLVEYESRIGTNPIGNSTEPVKELNRPKPFVYPVAVSAEKRHFPCFRRSWFHTSCRPNRI